MECFNPADYVSAELIDNQTIYELVYTESSRHLVITGWSERSIDLNELSSSLDIPNEERVNCFRDKNGFYCWVLSLSGKLIANTECDLGSIIVGCLPYLNNYINVALVYLEKQEGGNNINIIKYYFHDIITESNKKQKINILQVKFNDFFSETIEEKVFCSTLCKDIVNHYLALGIDRASTCVNPEDVNGNLSKLKDNYFDRLNNFLPEFSLFNYHIDRLFKLPILLRFKDIQHSEIWKSQDWGKEYEDYIPQRPVLGYYSSHDEDGCEGPHVVLCPVNIEKEVKKAKKDINPEIDEQLMYQIVLIHELAHAMMDKNHVSLNSLFSRAMEESLANMITLQWFKKFDHSNYEKVESFIKTQPEIYKFGINQFEAGVNWEKWRDSTKDMDGKLKDWFDTCFEGGKIRDIGPEAVCSAYDLVFNKD